MSFVELLPRLQELPRADKLRALQFLTTQLVKDEESPYWYPTVVLPAKALDGLARILPDGYAGDALADSEALYDEV